MLVDAKTEIEKNDVTTYAVNRNSLSYRLKKIIKNDGDLYLMLIPALLFYIIFHYLPMAGLLIAFKEYSPWKGIAASDWVGFKYFVEFFQSPYAWRVIRNTLTISLSSLILGFPMPIILALLLNELRGKTFKKSVQTISYIPHFISTVVIVGMVINFLNPDTGILNTIIKEFGFEPNYFLTNPNYFVSIYVLMEIWRQTGYNSIIYISAITSISEDLYEAATVDGANRWKQFVHITLPSLVPTIVIMLLVRLGSILNIGYEAIILLYNPSTYERADIISTYVYRTGIMESRFDYATAIGLINSVVACILVIFANKMSNKLTETGLW